MKDLPLNAGPADQSLLVRLVSGLAAETGEDFFLSLSEQLCGALNADYVVIGKLDPENELQVQTLAVRSRHRYEDAFSYMLSNTPCEQAIETGLCIYPENVQTLFPKDHLLVEMEAEGYAGMPLFDCNGGVLGILSVLFKDTISEPLFVEQLLKIFAVRSGNELERLKNEAELVAREQHFQQLFMHSPISYQSLDSDGCFLDVNPVWEETFGYLGDEVRGTPFLSYVTPDYQAAVRANFPVLKESGQVADVELEMLSKTGELLQVSLNGRSSYAPTGEFVRTHCVLRNVTEQKRAELELKRNEQRFRKLSQQFEALLQGISDRIALLDSSFRVLWTNDDAARNSGEVVGQCCYEFWYNRAAPCQNCPVAEVFSTAQAVSQQLEMQNGKILHLRAFPIMDEDSGLQVLLLSQDVTERVLLQEQQMRVGQLAAIGELAAGVAHEINNPITGVINYAQLLINRSEDGSKVADLARRIICEGGRVAEIVGHLLGLARDKKEMASVDIADILAETLVLVGTQLHKEGIDLSVSMADDVPVVYGYEQQLRQLFLNLLSNARYALNQRYPEANPNKRLVVSLALAAGDKGKLKVSFHDYGVGIPAEMVSKVLQPFFTTKPSSDGTGLGLSISHEIVKRHNGDIEIESEEGCFTIVDVLLPIVQKEKVNDEQNSGC